MTNNVKHLNNSQGKHLSIMGDNYRIVISGKETNGEFAMIDMLEAVSKVRWSLLLCTKNHRLRR